MWLLFQAGPSVRHKCLQAILRMIYYATPDLLRDVLSNITVSRSVPNVVSFNVKKRDALKTVRN